MKYIKLTSAIFFMIMITAIPFCFYIAHLKAVKMEELYRNSGIKIRHEGFELLLPLIFGIYSIPFLIWASTIYFKVNSESMTKRIIELIAILLSAVLPAIALDYFFCKSLG